MDRSDLPPDLTEAWLTGYNAQKFEARDKGEAPRMDGLTMVEGIVLWWENEVRPGAQKSQPDFDFDVEAEATGFEP